MHSRKMSQCYINITRHTFIAKTKGENIIKNRNKTKKVYNKEKNSLTENRT